MDETHCTDFTSLWRCDLHFSLQNKRMRFTPYYLRNFNFIQECVLWIVVIRVTLSNVYVGSRGSPHATRSFVMMQEQFSFSCIFSFGMCKGNCGGIFSHFLLATRLVFISISLPVLCSPQIARNDSGEICIIKYSEMLSLSMLYYFFYIVEI